MTKSNVFGSFGMKEKQAVWQSRSIFQLCDARLASVSQMLENVERHHHEAPSRPLVRIVMKLAHDRGDARLAIDQMIPPVAVAAEAAGLA